MTAVSEVGAEVEGTINEVIMSARETYHLRIKWASFNSKMVFNINSSLDKLHSIVIKLVCNVFNLLTLELEP